MSGKNSSKYITFICEANGCENKKTLYKSVYKNSSTHACSRECAAEIKKKKHDSEKNVKTEVSVSQKIDEYFRLNPPSLKK